jgi:endonuclease/exonuclease/phosphatase family metal-dependent hydrolase
MNRRKHSGLWLLASIVLMPACTSRQSGDDFPESRSHVLITYNVRVNVTSDGEHAWPHRADRVAALLRFHQADIAGLQEAQKNQIDDLAARLPEYDWYGVGRDDGVDGGEFVPVFYRRDRFTPVDRGAFWLSPTPDSAGSVGWDAALPRVTTWVLMEDNWGQRFYLYNTHFDHRGDTARVESARLLRRIIESRESAVPAILMGDFNARPDEEPYGVITSSTGGSLVLRDLASTVTDPYGPDLTFGSFEVGKEEDGRIDYIFATPGVSVIRVGVLTDQLRGHYPSDHLPVLAEIRLMK